MIEIEQIDYEREYKIYINAIKLLSHRGYMVYDASDMPSFEQFKSNYASAPMKVETFRHRTEPINIVLCMNLQRNITLDEKRFLALISGSFKEAAGIIIITKVVKKNGAIAVDAKTLENAKTLLIQEKFRVEFIKEENLMFCLMEHDLVPQHILITEKEKEELLKKYKVKPSQLPRILLSDPVSEYLGLKKGDVVKIIRKSETAGTYVTYRIASST